MATPPYKNQFWRRGAFAAALSFFTGGWSHEGRAETQVPPSRRTKRRLRQLSHARHLIILAIIFVTKLDKQIPGAFLLIQQHGKPVYFKSFSEGSRGRAADDGGRDFPDLFNIEGRHLGRRNDLVDDGKLALDDPVSKYIHSFLRDQKVGVDLSR